ncbi:metal ABC transporter solute-binding protein, Zn/Mn family [Peptostreptococcus faecalis]|uniref:metal ABC transporter solute-binding protein, Zn/Mn family n=1 Tax=Peptostreptococcus faecalis TaxID=2045015 RepID=UPI000C7B2D41|nr:zinc ABC transporter substrate-binding protein [Peptostreptococcus faecalis]
MKKKIIPVLILCFFFISIAGYVFKYEKREVISKISDKKSVAVTTSFLADMVSQISGDKFKVDLIIPAGEDPHLYVAKPKDVDKILDADLLLYQGLHFEGKMISALEKKGVAVTKNFSKNNLGTMDSDGDKIVDPHFWFNIDLYKKAVDVACEELVKLSLNDKALFEKNTREYKVKLDKLNEENRKKINEIPSDRRYLVTPHDAFNYFSKSYNIKVVAPQGIGTDSEISNKDIDKAADFIIKNHIKSIFSESTTNPERMEKIREIVRAKGSDVKVVSGSDNELFSDSLAPKGEVGSTYIQMYKHNIDLIYNNLK